MRRIKAEVLRKKAKKYLKNEIKTTTIIITTTRTTTTTTTTLTLSVLRKNVP